MRWNNKMIKLSNTCLKFLTCWDTETKQRMANSTIVRPCSGPVWRCTGSGRSLHTDCRRARGPRWRRLPPDRWGRGSCGCRRRRRAPLPPNCSEERTSSGRPDWRAVENREYVRNGRRKTGSWSTSSERLVLTSNFLFTLHRISGQTSDANKQTVRPWSLTPLKELSVSVQKPVQTGSLPHSFTLKMSFLIQGLWDRKSSMEKPGLGLTADMATQ